MQGLVRDVFFAVDRMDPDEFVSYLTEDARFKFGNAQAVVGRQGIKKAVSGFFGTIKALSHSVLNVWELGDSVISEVEVTYTRKDGKSVVLPCMNLFHMKGNKINDYKIFIDLTPLYA